MGSDNTPWTTRRCNSILRPLLSKIRLLRKELRNGGAQDGGLRDNTRDEGLEKFKASGKRTFSSMDSVSGPELTCAADWAASPRPPKKIKRTYSARTKAQLAEATQHSQCGLSQSSSEPMIGLPVFLTTDDSANASQNSVDGTSHDGTTRAAQSRQTNHRLPFLELAKEIAPNCWRLLDGIYMSLFVLLRATAEEAPSATGCRSLFSMCFKVVPQYIEQEEMLARMEDPDTEADSSSAVYDELVQTFSASENGLEPLREIVRAHGIHVINNAIAEGLLSLEVARHLYSLCLRTVAYDEAQAMLENMISSVMLRAKASSDSTAGTDEIQSILTLVSDFARRTGRNGFLYHQIAMMLIDGILPLDCVSGQAMVSCWNGVVQSITQNDEHAQSAAAFLLRTTISLAYKQTQDFSASELQDVRLQNQIASQRPTLRSSTIGQESRKHGTELAVDTVPCDTESGTYGTVSEILTAFAATNLLLSTDPAPHLSTFLDSSVRILEDMAFEARQALEIASYNVDPHCTKRPLFDWVRLPLLAASISSTAASESLQTLSTCNITSLETLARLHPTKETIGNDGSFLSSVATCCGRTKPGAAFWYMKTIVNKLMAISTANTHEVIIKKACGSIALAAAFSFSEETGQPEHLDWALGLELQLHSQKGSPPKTAAEKTPARGTMQRKTGFRWEEGICEWIARTPALELRKPSKVEPDVSDGEGITAIHLNSCTPPVPHVSKSSPCYMEKRSIQKLNKKGDEAKASHISIRAKHSKSIQGKTSKRSRFRSARKPLQHSTNLKPSHNIEIPEDLDELSTPNSSQEDTGVLSTMERPQNMRLYKKSKKHTYPTRAVIASKMYKKSHLMHSTVSPTVHDEVECQASDTVDELAFL